MTALVTMGEGFHNFHHQFPLDYRNGLRFYHFDPTKWLIYGLTKVGFARDLKRVSIEKILRYQVDMTHSRLQGLAEEIPGLLSQLAETIQPLYESVLQSLTRLAELEKHYLQDKQAQYQRQCKGARVELQQRMAAWLAAANACLRQRGVAVTV